MLGGVVLQLREGFSMTAATQLRFHFALFVLDITRAVGLVTFRALRIGHGFGVSCMTVETTVCFTVFSVTFHAIHLCMHARMLLHLFTGPAMAGQTHRLHGGNGVHLHFHGRMGIVARGALVHPVVRRSIRCMALATCGDYAAFCGGMIRMAIATRDILSVRSAGTRQGLNLGSMTRSALIHRGGITPAIVGWLVRRMTPEAVCMHHLGSVGFMTFHALHELSCGTTVFQVAIGTRHMGVRTGNFIERLPHLLVAGKAYRGHIIINRREWRDLRGMGRMTARTVVQGIVFVGGRGMALGTRRNNRLCCGRVTLMAVEATQCGTVSATLFSYLHRRVYVTLDTI